MEMESRRPFHSLSDSIHSLLGLKNDLNGNWLHSVCNIIKSLPPPPDQRRPSDEEGEHTATAISKIQNELDSLTAKIQLLNFQRRQVLNELLDLKGNIRVFCRVRPIGEDINGSQKRVVNCGSNQVHVNFAENNSKFYTFDKVFQPTSSQGEVFSEVEPIIKSALDGYNACIFAYGQTGTGKTFTMEGSQDLPGVVPRAIQALFEQAAESNHTVLFKFSMLEIYMGYLKDLLIPHNSRATNDIPPCLSIQTHPSGDIEIESLVSIQVNDLNQAMRLYSLGCRLRSTASTNSNRTSSRSHCLIRISISCSGATATERRRETNKLWMIDLGGSERVLKTKTWGRRFEEGKAINLSLSALGDVIHALQTRQRHIPYRNSKLTQVLKDSLGEDSKTLMLVHVSPREEDLCETICSLSFATRVKSIHLGNKESTEARGAKEIAMHSLQQKMMQIEDARNDIGGKIKNLNEKLGNLSGISSSSSELLNASDTLNDGPQSARENVKTAVPSSNLPRFMRPTICSRKKSGKNAVEYQAPRVKASIPPRSRKTSSHHAESVAFPIQGGSVCTSESSISRTSCFLGLNKKFSAESEPEYSKDASDSENKTVVLAEREEQERDSKNHKFKYSHRVEDQVNRRINSLHTWNHSKVDNWLQLHKYTPNNTSSTHRNKKVLAIPIPEKKSKGRGRIPKESCDEEVQGQKFRRRNIKHLEVAGVVDAKVEMETTSDAKVDVETVSEAEGTVTSVVLTDFSDNVADSTSSNTDEKPTKEQAKVYAFLTDQCTYSNSTASADLEGSKMTAEEIVSKETYSGSFTLKSGKSNFPTCKILTENPYILTSSEEKHQCQAVPTEAVEHNDNENANAPAHSLRDLQSNDANQKDMFGSVLPKNRKYAGLCNTLKQNIQMLLVSFLVLLGFQSLGLGHDFFQALTL
ncbi:kinesin-like protein KIN-14B isoform X2 [Ipomoea triloba]|nr:kinesin-like protein KIN-14B isoform X2 [Ipomoea triloba]